MKVQTFAIASLCTCSLLAAAAEIATAKDTNSATDTAVSANPASASTAEVSVKTHTETARVQDAESKAISPEMVFSDAKMAEIERMFSTSKDGQTALASFRERMKERRESWDYYAEVDAELAQAQQDLLKELQSGNNSNPALTARKLKDVETRRAELHDLMKKAIPDFNREIGNPAKKARDAADAGADTNGKNRYDVNDDGKVTEKELATVKQQELAEQEKERKSALIDAQTKYDKAKAEFEASRKDIGTTFKDYAMASCGYAPTVGKDGKVTRMLVTHDEQGEELTAEEAQKRQLYARMYMDENGNVVPITHMQDPRYKTSVRDQFHGTKSDVMVTPEQVAKTDKYFASKRKFEETGAALQDAAIHLHSTQRAIKTNNETLARLGDSEGDVIWETGSAKQKQGQGQTTPQQQSNKPEEPPKQEQQQPPKSEPGKVDPKTIEALMRDKNCFNHRSGRKTKLYDIAALDDIVFGIPVTVSRQRSSFFAKKRIGALPDFLILS